jgi:hypothetical protein
MVDKAIQIRPKMLAHTFAYCYQLSCDPLARSNNRQLRFPVPQLVLCS